MPAASIPSNWRRTSSAEHEPGRHDNAKSESFMKTLKQEEADGRDDRDVDVARGSIARFIEEVCNRQRLHSALGYRPPAEFETGCRHCRSPPPDPQTALNPVT
jgi:putative transposase